MTEQTNQSIYYAVTEILLFYIVFKIQFHIAHRNKIYNTDTKGRNFREVMRALKSNQLVFFKFI